MLSVRDSCHATGRPSRTAAAAQTRYSPYTRSFAPNPPPTSGATTRTFDRSSPSHSATSFRTSNGTCVETHRVSPPSSVGSATAAFVSIGTGASRWCTTRARTITSAPSSTSSSHASSNVWARLVPASGNSIGAPGARAASGPTTGSSGSISTTTDSAASCACSRVSASTTATGSPTYRTTSAASTGRGKGPSTLPAGGWGARSRSTATRTAATPGIADASAVSTPEIRPCAMMDRTNTARRAPSGRIAST